MAPADRAMLTWLKWTAFGDLATAEFAGFEWFQKGCAKKQTSWWRSGTPLMGWRDKTKTPNVQKAIRFLRCLGLAVATGGHISIE